MAGTAARRYLVVSLSLPRNARATSRTSQSRRSRRGAGGNIRRTRLGYGINLGKNVLTGGKKWMQQADTRRKYFSPRSKGAPRARPEKRPSSLKPHRADAVSICGYVSRRKREVCTAHPEVRSHVRARSNRRGPFPAAEGAYPAGHRLPPSMSRSPEPADFPCREKFAPACCGRGHRSAGSNPADRPAG